MTPNKSDSVCDCIYGDGACEKHSDSGELIRFVVLQATLTGSKYTDGEISKEQYKAKVAEYVSTITAHIQAVGEERVRESPDLPSLLRSYRKSLGLRQVDFAKRYGMSSPTAVSFWESGQRSMPNEVFADLLQYDRQRLAQYLGDKD